MSIQQKSSSTSDGSVSNVTEFNPNHNIPEEGAVIGGRYKVISKIAQTQISAIFIAEDTHMQRKVALKHLFKSSKSDDSKSVIREAHLLSTMSHPNILTVYDYTADENGTYIISEFLSGFTLQEYIEKQALGLEDFLSITEQMLLGLSEAHKQGIIHGDLKPNNVMIVERASGKKQVKLLDFGLSRIAANNSNSSGGGIAQGSAYFLSPEEFNGAEKNVLSDIYSMGCLCYFALTRKYPFNGDNTMQIMAAHIQHAFYEPVSHFPGLPTEVNQWLLWMMNLRPETRPPSVHDALSTLHSCFEQIKKDEIRQELIDTQTHQIALTSSTAPFPLKGATSAQSLKTVTAAVKVDNWPELRTVALRAIIKLLTKDQAVLLLVRSMEKYGFKKSDDVPKEFWMPIVSDLCEKIPNRYKREALSAEIIKAIRV